MMNVNFKKTQHGKAKEFVQAILDSFTPAERSLLSFMQGGVKSINALFNYGVSPGRPAWNNLMFFNAIGGAFPSYAKGTIYFPPEMNDPNRIMELGFVKGEGFEMLPNLEDLNRLKEGDVFLSMVNPCYKLDREDWKAVRMGLAARGVIISTLTSLMRDKIVESNMSYIDLMDYVHNCFAEDLSWAGKPCKAIQLNKRTSCLFRCSEEELSIIEGLNEYPLRQAFSINGKVPPSRYLIMAMVVNYLSTSRNDTVMRGRRAYLSDVFVDEVTVGWTHDILDVEKAWKNGNLSVAASKMGYIPLITKGDVMDQIKVAEHYHALGIPTFMHKSAKYLLVGPGAEAVGVSLVDGLYEYMTNVDKPTKLMGRHLHGIPTAITRNMVESGVSILVDGKELRWKGHRYTVCRIQSPLVEEGSGNGIGHPDLDTVRVVEKFQFNTINDSIPGAMFGEEGARESVILPAVGDIVPPGGTVIHLRKTVKDKKGNFKEIILPRRKNTGCMEGRVTSVRSVWNPVISTLEVKIMMANCSRSSAQKFRGTGKYRILPFCRNIQVFRGDNAVFDPNQPLDDVNCIEHLVGDEEGKTLTQVIEMAANVIGAKWVGDHWEDEEAIKDWIKTNRFGAKIVRSNIEPTVYHMLKLKFENDVDFTFDDQSFTITHINANAWIGQVTEVIETPLTETFVGKTNLFGEVVSYLGIQWPSLYKVLNQEILSNQEALHYIYEMAKDSNQPSIQHESDPWIIIDPVYGTQVVFGDKLEVLLAGMTPDEAYEILGLDEEAYKEYLEQGNRPIKVSKIVVPYDTEMSLDTLRGIHKKLNYYNKEMEAAGLDLRFNGFNMYASNGQNVRYAHVYPSVIARFAGSIDNNMAQTFLRILIHLGMEDGMDEDGLNLMRMRDGWESLGYRLLSMLVGSLESLGVESSTLMGKASRTTDIAFQCRVATTIDGDCDLNSAMMSTKMAEYLGLMEGDTLLVGRNPLPKMGAVNLVIDDRVPFGVLMLNALTWHAICEGDADGDSVIFLALTPDGDIVIPSL